MEVVERKLDAAGWSQLLHFATDEVWLRFSQVPHPLALFGSFAKVRRGPCLVTIRLNRPQRSLFFFGSDLILGLTDNVFWEAHVITRCPALGIV